ncbi:MAG: KOW domain-containing RNA-binding protein [Oscillospiraceae bacterium]|jgi:ribosomal protein L14E/L6E/L27E|nr:KOW domain-containing RNA-binding protein [Oscillospiraceae bacterium]
MEKEERYFLVKSVAGHDKGSWYAAVKREAGFVYIADGRRRKVASPKKKNIKHVEITRKTIRVDALTDKALRKALWGYNFADAGEEEADGEPNGGGVT